MRAGVREVLPSPPPPQALADAVQRLASKLQDSTTNRAQGQVMAFLPCKGGAGATFLATNLGWALARNHSVLLIDLNLQFGDALARLLAFAGWNVTREYYINDGGGRSMCWPGQPMSATARPMVWSRKSARGFIPGII